MIIPDTIYLLKLALAGFAGGAIFGALSMFVGLTFNLKRVRTIYDAAGIPVSLAIYKAAALAFGAMGAVIIPMMPILDANGVKDPWYGLAMMAAMVPFFILFTRHVKRLRKPV